MLGLPTRYGPPVRPVTVEEQLALSEDDDEDDEEGGEDDDEESDGGWSPEDRDFVPEDLTDLKMRIKVTCVVFGLYLCLYLYLYQGDRVREEGEG